MAELRSERIELLASDAPSDPGAVAAFWREVAAAGSPLIEPDGGDSDHRLVTFLWRDPARTLGNVVVVGGAAPWERILELTLRRVGDTDVWARTFRAPVDLRSRYWLSPDDSLEEPGTESDHVGRYATLRPDPFNPRVSRRQARSGVPGDPDEAFSILELPGAPPLWSTPSDAAGPPGRTQEATIASSVLGAERRVWWYAPAETDPRWLLVMSDGWEWVHIASLGRILDAAAARGAIPPIAALLVDTDEEHRDGDLRCNASFVRFLADEAVPWALERIPGPSRPPKVIVAGQSLGGLNALFSALERPDVFPRVIAQSGSFWWSDGEGSDSLLSRLPDDPGVRLEVFLEVGTLEGSAMIGPSRAMHQALADRRHVVRYREYSGGHDWLNWQVGLIDGLRWLTSGADAPRHPERAARR